MIPFGFSYFTLLGVNHQTYMYFENVVSQAEVVISKPITARLVSFVYSVKLPIPVRSWLLSIQLSLFPSGVAYLFARLPVSWAHFCRWGRQSSCNPRSLEMSPLDSSVAAELSAFLVIFSLSPQESRFSYIAAFVFFCASRCRCILCSARSRHCRSSINLIYN